MRNYYSYKLNDPQHTQRFACKLAGYLRPGSILTLEGNLGAGKTTFTQGLATGLGISEIVNSPSFTIIKEYYGKYTLYHMDVYRLEKGFDDIDFEEYFYGQGITVIEWASIIKDILPDNYLNIKFEILGDNLRNILFEPHGENYRRICEEFNANEYFVD